ncbi:GEM-like protein 2 [Gastrolobium bilobum]|uniref:GEM-like protein 2 n=1 Tax=Gastrolobium bilobum TaxID=150636 RepID=UPI002AAF0BB6|nr:GEM-like protein 2 [Gastrolobium bilobum]
MKDYREIPVTVKTNSTGLHNHSNSSNNNNPYVHISPVPPSSAATNRPNAIDTISGALNHCSRKVGEATRQAGIMVDNIWNHLRTSSSPADAAMARVVQGTKVLSKGGPDKLFQQTYGIFPGEKLLRPYACYISTTSEPVIGTLYISTKRLAFCSDYPLCHHPFSLQHQCMYYKVEVQLDQLSTVSPSTNRLNPTEKYIQIVTVDGYEFFFMGFISYDKALKTLNQALQQYHNHSSGNASVQLL